MQFPKVRFLALLIWYREVRPNVLKDKDKIFRKLYIFNNADLKPTLVWAWATSTGNGWRLAILVGAIPFALAFVSRSVDFSGLDHFPWILSLIEFLLWYIFSAIEIAVLSIAFRELSGWHKSKSFEELQTYK